MRLSILTIVVIACLFTEDVKAIVQSTAENDSIFKTIELKDVVVNGSRMIVTENKISLTVDKNLRKHSYDGYTLLNVAMLPGLDVNPFDRTVQSHSHEVKLCINGVAATQDEIRTLNPKEITNVEFYTGYDPRFSDSQYTVNFIVKIRDYGGAVVLEATQFLNKPTGAEMADWRMYHGKTEFGIGLEENFDNYAQGLYQEENLSLNFQSGQVCMRGITNIDKVRNQSLRAKPYLVIRKPNDTFKLAVAFQHQNSRNDKTETDRYVRPSGETENVAITNANSARLLPSLSSTYTHKFNRDRYLNIFLHGNYSHTDNHKDYLSTHDVISKTKENFYGLSLNTQYSFKLSSTNSAFIQAGTRVNRSIIYYDENKKKDGSRLTTVSSSLYIGDNWRICKGLQLNAHIAALMLSRDNNRNKTTEFTLAPTVRINWSICQGNTINASFSIRNQQAPMSYYSPYEQWVMPLLRQVGNPDLQNSRKMTGSINYKNVRKWGYLEVFSSYTGMTKSVYYDFTCDDAREVYIQTFKNGGTFHDVTIGPRLQVKIVPQHLTLRVEGAWNYVRTQTYTQLHRHTLTGTADLMLMVGGFTANLTCSTPATHLSELGAVGYVPWNVQLGCYYNINNWNIGATIRNPFMTKTTWSRAELPGVYENSVFYSPRIRYNMVALTVGYRFGYGKPKKKYEEVKIEEGENSAILDR